VTQVNSSENTEVAATETPHAVDQPRPEAASRAAARVSRRPVVGVAAALERVTTSAGEALAAFVTEPYLAHVVRAGAVPLLLAPSAELAAEPDAALDLVDALLLVGGGDIDPAHYGAERHPATEPPVPARDVAELALARRALERDLPTLGICRGMQLLNVALGGTLHQHLPDVLGHTRHHEALPGAGGAYEVHLADGSLAARAAGARALRATHSRHHQGVARVGRGLEVTGWAADELPVAVEHVQARFVLGVQ
jgi:putative glutamine amidotransferase